MNYSQTNSQCIPAPVVWLTGLPASGKTTIARKLQEDLCQRGHRAVLLDSDRLREVLTPKPTYEQDERDRFYDVLVGLAVLLAGQGVPVVIAATGHLRRYRQTARERLDRFCEVWVDCPLEVCQARDPKGLYAQTDQKTTNTLPGVGTGYEPPPQPELTVHSDREPATQSAQHIIDVLTTLGWLG